MKFEPLEISNDGWETAFSQYANSKWRGKAVSTFISAGWLAYVCGYLSVNGQYGGFLMFGYGGDNKTYGYLRHTSIYDGVWQGWHLLQFQ